MLTPVLSQGPQGEAVGCSQGGGIKVPGLSLSRDPNVQGWPSSARPGTSHAEGPPDSANYFPGRCQLLSSSGQL